MQKVVVARKIKMLIMYERPLESAKVKRQFQAVNNTRKCLNPNDVAAET